ncbi:iron complex transport system ATP-binding protein [Microbacterium resistens]|uniref:Iron complex transport system ATP-binding protein n=1 Tax=Microbacterium resistens TaxID=156977 RepID=A0ABU1SB18_9MICO|nr:ABC transporter ATP-binding protein [Microbacterium resistens]MDR6866766.1 iron complex transport system ATP-binding protein [Microbacterium resistens]
MTPVELPETLAPGELRADGLALRYGRTPVVHDVSVRLRPGAVTALIGPNGSGKSTALRAIARLHRVHAGSVRIGGAAETVRDVSALSAREFARAVAMLSQSRPHPSGVEVRDVVAHGRHPHRGRFSGLTEADRDAIAQALALTGLAEMAHRAVDELSGGELQRVWLATALAQDTGILLLDEPTNHLDLRYQIETLDLVRDLADRGTALGVVLHDLDHAAAVADHVVLLHRGRVHAAGDPADVLTAENLSLVYGLRIDTVVDAETGRVRVVPKGRHHDRPRPRPSRDPHRSLRSDPIASTTEMETP